MISATPAHAAFCAALHAASFPPDAAWSGAAFAELLASPGVYGLINPVGGIVLARRIADEAEILTLATHPGVQRQGIGRALLHGAIGRAAAEGARRVFLEVAETNIPARALYEGVGFSACGRRRRYYPDGGDALVLQFTPGG